MSAARGTTPRDSDRSPLLARRGGAKRRGGGSSTDRANSGSFIGTWSTTPSAASPQPPLLARRGDRSDLQCM